MISMKDRYSQWTRASELGWWLSETDDYYLKRITDKYAAFNVDVVVHEHFKNRLVRRVMDVGGGKFGGALRCYTGTGFKILVDVLGDEFDALGKLPMDVTVCISDFNRIPFSDGAIDVLFAWEVLDHALTWAHFEQGQKELVRLLAPGGLLFVHVPLRAQPDSFHIATPDAQEIMQGFLALRIIDDFQKLVPQARDMRDQVFTILTKD